MGRILPELDPTANVMRQQEFYICFRDGTSQSVIEAAFELQHTKLYGF